MKEAGVAPSDIDLVLVGTTTPDLIFPNVACLVQEKLGIAGCPAFSLEAACSGFVYSLVVADQFIRLKQARRALVLGAETMSRIIDWTDRETCVLFGDGAGAVILEAAEQPGIMYSTLGADGRYRELLYASSGVSTRHRAGSDIAALRMKGNEAFGSRRRRNLSTTRRGKERHREGANRLVDTAPGEYPHHQRNRQTLADADGASRLDRAGARQHVVGFRADGPRHGYSRRAYQARRSAAARGLRRGIHLGCEPRPLLILRLPIGAHIQRRGNTYNVTMWRAASSAFLGVLLGTTAQAAEFFTGRR
jgi:hypothetical protein